MNKSFTKRPHKYGAKSAVCTHGETHPSRKEANRCNQLHLLQRGGLISGLETQVQYWFVIDGVQVKMQNGRRAGVKLDFRYVENGRLVVEDTKGVSVRDWPLRAAIFRALFPDVELRET